VRRREFITLLGGAMAAWPLVTRAQQPTVPVIGFLSGTSSRGYAPYAFREGLREGGFVEGQNVKIEYRWADDHYERLPELAADLVNRSVALIAAPNNATALAAKAATATIPIVFLVGDDPVRLGLVASLNRPGGNITGVTSLNRELGRKRLELLHELLPSATVLAVLVKSDNPNTAEYQSNEVQAEANAFGLQLHVLQASHEEDFDTVFAEAGEIRAGGLVISPDPLFLDHSEQLAALASRQAVPTISPYREFAVAGGLVSYGGSLTDQLRLIGVYTSRILKGEKPADLPVQQTMKVELIVNLKTAKALGITVPQSVQSRADEVIE